MTGVYCIVDVLNNTYYIGESGSIGYRFKKHKSMLKRECHPNKSLQEAWANGNEKSFAFIVLEECDESKRQEKELNWINHFSKVAKVFNLRNTYTPEQQADALIMTKNSFHAKYGICFGAWHKLRKGKECKPYVMSEATKVNIGKGNKGKIRTEEMKEHQKKVHTLATTREQKDDALLMTRASWTAKHGMSDSVWKRLRNEQRYTTPTSSKYKGVSYYKGNLTNPWTACINKDGKRNHLGYYATEEEAAKAYNEKAKELHGDSAKLNKIEA